MLQAGIALEAVGDLLGREAERRAGSEGRGCILGVVAAPQGTDAGEIGDDPGLAVLDLDDACIELAGIGGDAGEDAIVERLLAADLDEGLTRGRTPPRHLLRRLIVDADDGGVRGGDQPLLDRAIGLEGAVPVEMIRRQVHLDADRRLDGRCQVDLEGRALHHMDAIVGRRLERQHGGADIATHLDVAAGRLQHMRDQGGGGRLAIGAGDADHRSLRRDLRPLQEEQLDVADHRDSCGLGLLHRPVRRRMGQRHAGREHESGKARPVGAGEIEDVEALGRRLVAARLVIVPASDPGPSGDQRARRREPRAAEAEEG